MINRICIREQECVRRLTETTTSKKEREKEMKTKEDRDALFQETVFMLFALDIVTKLVIYGTAAFCILK